MKKKVIREYTIRIDKEVEIEGNRQIRKITEKMFYVDIKNSYGGGIGFSVKIGLHYGKSLKKVFKKIVEELHL